MLSRRSAMDIATSQGWVVAGFGGSPKAEEQTITMNKHPSRARRSSVTDAVGAVLVLPVAESGAAAEARSMSMQGPSISEVRLQLRSRQPQPLIRSLQVLDQSAKLTIGSEAVILLAQNGVGEHDETWPGSRRL
jgi:hypothetical protein